MYLEHFQLNAPPFADSLKPETFFPENRSLEIGQSLIQDILAGKLLLKLVGRDGDGKSLLCKVLEERLPDSYQVVVLQDPSGSFEDLLWLMGRALSMEVGEIASRESLVEQGRQLLAGQQATGIRRVLIIDEAEKMFAATLERLLRTIDDGDGASNLTLLLVGRPGLDERLAQMAALGTAVEFDVSYQLEPFSESGTRQYLRHRCTVAGMSREHFAEVFTEPVITKILATAQGNPRLINTLAEEALKNFCAEKSFMVLLDHVEPESEQPALSRSSRILEFYELLLDHKRITMAVVAVMVLFLVIGILLSRSGNGTKTLVPPAARETTLTPSPTANPTSALPRRDQRDGEALFRERLGASASWLAGMYKGSYTIQLMMLSSTSAEYSLADTLVQDDYYPLRDQFYILRKLTNPPSFFVFYGVYNSLEAAREARNSMPVFLRKHHPYPLAIGEAMRKIEQ
jgi:type II secretory pathway predicted ATPase ExeA